MSPTNPDVKEGDEMRMTVMQGHEAIPWAVHLRIYEQYAKRFGTNQSAMRVAERGGFSVEEADKLYPAWRDECEELLILRARVKRLEIDLGKAREERDAFARDVDKSKRMTK